MLDLICANSIYIHQQSNMASTKAKPTTLKNRLRQNYRCDQTIMRNVSDIQSRRLCSSGVWLSRTPLSTECVTKRYPRSQFYSFCRLFLQNLQVRRGGGEFLGNEPENSDLQWSTVEKVTFLGGMGRGLCWIYKNCLFLERMFHCIL